MTLFADYPDNPNGLVVLCDRRTVYDERTARHAVLRGFSLGIKTLGRKEWLRTTRIAAYNPQRETSAAGRAGKRDEIRAILARLRPRVCVVMASRKKERKQKFRGSEDDDGADESIKGTLCWEALNPPTSIENMCGTFWERDGTLFVALQNPFNMEHVFNWQISNHLQRAWRVASGAEDLLHVGREFEPGDGWPTGPLAVDIETIPSSETITMIGVSDGERTVSLPWDAYRLHTGTRGREEWSLGANDAECRFIRHVLRADTPKVLHNAEYDIPFLRSRGIEVNGEVFDTMLLHGVVYKQFRHGLQACVAQEFAVHPWKTLFGAGRDRSPDPQVWAMRQHELRIYNEQDTFYTWHLCRALAPKAGVHVEGMTCSNVSNTFSFCA